MSYRNDHINTPLVMTNSSGTVVWKGLYNAFGHADIDTSSTITNNLRFPGQYFDSETSLHYNWNRYHDPGTGRYITADPIGLEGGRDPYVYVDNQPVNNIDPEGLAIWICNRIVRNWFIGGVIGGNHAYLWDDRNKSCCGRASTRTCKENGPNRDVCRKIAGSDGKENEIMNCCKKTADDGMWFPPTNDCHTAANKCITSSGLKNPGAPGGRLGRLCDPCDDGTRGSW